MKEKILEKLKTQRGTPSQVSDRTLEDLASSLETVITTDEILVLADFTKSIASLDGNINHTAAERVKKLQEDSKAEAEKAKKAEEEATAAAAEAARVKGTKDEIPAYAKILMEQNAKLAERMDGFTKEKVTNNRLDSLNTALKTVPEFFKAPILSAFKNTNFENEETFSEYLKGIETNRDAFLLAAKENGLNSAIPGLDVKPPVVTGETAVLADARKIANELKEKQTQNKN